MKTVKLIFAASMFMLISSLGLSAQNSPSPVDPASSHAAAQANLPWTPKKIEYHRNANGKTFEFHYVAKEDYLRMAGRHPQMYVSDLDDCRRQAGDCLETVVIRPAD